MTEPNDAIDNPDLPTINREYAANHVQRHNMAGFRAPKIGSVKVGIIGFQFQKNAIFLMLLHEFY